MRWRSPASRSCCSRPPLRCRSTPRLWLCSHVRSAPRPDCPVLGAAPPGPFILPSAAASATRLPSVRLRPRSLPPPACMRSGPCCVSPVFLSLSGWRTRRGRVGWPRSRSSPTGSSSPCRGACELALGPRRIPVRVDPVRTADLQGSDRRRRTRRGLGKHRRDQRGARRWQTCCDRHPFSRRAERHRAGATRRAHAAGPADAGFGACFRRGPRRPREGEQMPTYDRTHGTTSAPSEADSRLDRPLRLDWSALFGGTLIGWGMMLVLALVAMAVGLAVIDPFVARPAASNAGAAIWGGISAVIASFIGAFAIIRLSGDRRRSESLMHGTVSWSMSMLLAGMIALYVSGVAAFSRTPVNNTALHRGTRGQTAALVETTGNGPLVAAFATAGAVLALVGSLLGALAAASRSSGVPFSDEFRPKRRQRSEERA